MAVVVTAVVLTASGCATRGPAAICVQRARYSAAIQQTTDEQLLQNIVRLRYGQTPTFLEIAGIVVQLSVDYALQAAPPTGIGPTLTLPVGK
jgi:hypothetical protein